MSDSSPPSGPGASADRARWFAEQVYPYDAALKSYLRGGFPSVRDVDDVVQESYLRVWRRRGTGPIQSAKAFLFKVAERLALDLVRRNRRSPIIDVKDFEAWFVFDTQPDARNEVSRQEHIQLLVAAIDSLPERCREIFILCHLQGLRQSDVALRLDISESTVGVQAARGLQRCEAFVRHRLKDA